ncbi:hypothetical protein AYO20_02060 [Fonsecaea nubica]|uniref:Uncharacterized protein n=1 Tax=Fonsecaea nubica TaxID=856822 RepID=A0A178DC26_9EURO|nr:hypothetical protein AYO20_02060 [Fonsecaea nubica]OAL38854.1 hypothetical protein AYO20_02060 [Fonsecaea nubica]
MANTEYSVPTEAEKVFRTGILQNPLITPYLPEGWEALASTVSFEGSPSPSIPINWRFAESISALKAYEAVLVNAILKKKYNHDPVEVRINTDHAQLFFMSTLLWRLDPQGADLNALSILQPELRQKMDAYFPDWDKHGSLASLHRMAATNIYRTKDDRFFHIHGSIDPRPTIESLGLPQESSASSLQEAFKPYVEAVSRFTAEELQDLETNRFRQAGTICYSIDEYNNSEHGKANAHIGLFEIHHRPNPVQQATWWPDAPSSPGSPKRPLAGLKVVDLTRVIASPAVSRGLAELGASVMRIVSPNITDTSGLHLDLNHGKWNACLDLKVEADREKLRELIRGADVFLQGYRPHVLDKYGFGEQDILDLVKDRDRGIVYARENCYGWNGPWKDRSGWQQISDANCGVSLEFGRAMGNDEPVTPVFPNSDYCTGIAGTIGILTALVQRAEKGGSYTVDIALNYYSRWLTSSVGAYPSAVWDRLWTRHGRPVFRHTDSMMVLLPAFMKMLRADPDSAAALFQPGFFTEYAIKHLGGVTVRIVAPVLRFPGGEVEPGYNVSTRTNGVDQPRWPDDLSVEVVV